MSQDNVIRLLLKERELTSREISRKLGISQQTIIKNLKKLNRQKEIMSEIRKIAYSRKPVAFYRIK